MRRHPRLCGVLIAIWLALAGGTARAQGAENPVGKKPSVETDDLGLCTVQKPMSPVASAPRWTSWGVDLSNSRFQPSAGLRAADVPKLKLKWAIGFPGSSHAWSQPTVAGGRVFVGSQGGHVYALDAKTGCVDWSFQATGAVRTAIVIGEGNSTLAYFTTIPGWLYALDAQSGALVWKKRVEDHVSTRLTGSPVLYGGRLYVPAASFEEGMSTASSYECCSFHGSLSAFDALTGALIWKHDLIGVASSVLKTSASGKKLLGPAGGSIWSSPVVDPKRKLLYVTTGNGFSGPPQPLTDAIVAMDIDTGQVRWSRQVAEDIFVPGCGKPGNANFSCPEENGPRCGFRQRADPGASGGPGLDRGGAEIRRTLGG